MVPLLVTATTPHGVVLSRPWGVALDGLMASVLWHRRKWAARASGSYLTYRHDHTPEGIVKLSEVGAVANHISLMRHI